VRILLDECLPRRLKHARIAGLVQDVEAFLQARGC